ncbi:uncharacterized protein LOC116209404 isoform X2 [Punica granatum]|uniref:Uncharacterized protein LOC116209404 isoform X2 n=1 Tax=Punica granatum TaxID=22663 RepID=A0A6P8DWZ6_PUNGR|nr:uncharacterized protein LOC116209404 isoform X2 [Punica granatum]
MAMKLHDRLYVSSSSTGRLWSKHERYCYDDLEDSAHPYLSRRPVRTCFSCKSAVTLDYLLINWKHSRKRSAMRVDVLDGTGHCINNLPLGIKRDFLSLRKSRRVGHFTTLASAEDGVTVNGSPQGGTSSGDVEDMRVKLDRTLQDEDYNDGLVQSLHDAARVFELAIKEHSSHSRVSWFTTAWLGIDRNAWLKTLSYQASIYSLLQAASEISSRGDHRDRDVNVFVQRSLSRQYAPLESVIREKLLDKQPDIYDWFWSEQVPAVVTSFVNYFEGDSRFTATTTVGGKGMSVQPGNAVSVRPGNASDTSLLMLALTCVAAITKLGPAKVSCPQFFSMIPDVTGRLMDMLVDFVLIQQAYKSVKKIGLRREFLLHFGPRAASCRVRNDRDAEEVSFWVNLITNQLQRAIDRDRIWSRLTTSESIEVLERDLAIFGFFIALGRRTQVFLCANGFDGIGDPIEGCIRYFIGGSVLYYPQLSSISSYQLFVEVVCEELDWLPFFPGLVDNPKQSHGHKSKQELPPNPEAIPQALDVCSHWIQSFIKYSKWLENPSNVKAARFLSRGHNKLMECREDLGILKNEGMEINTKGSSKAVTTRYSTSENKADSLDKALESVEEALMRLEELLQELHVSSSSSGKEHLKAACSDLEKIRKLKKEAEFLEASFRAKAASLQQGDGDGHSKPSISGQKQFLKGKNRNGDTAMPNSGKSNSRGLWNFFKSWPSEKPDSDLATLGGSLNAEMDSQDSELSGIRRFELLRNELIELEKRVQRSANKSDTDEDIQLAVESAENDEISLDSQLVQVQKKVNIIEKSLDKLKDTSRDVWQGTQLLAIDVGASMELLRRGLIGDELTGKEKKALRRTMTDLASVVPIGVLMLLPVTAVGHAAMLAAIQRYVPQLIPSTYGPERLDLLRQLEKVKELETSEANPKEPTEELA